MRLAKPYQVILLLLAISFVFLLTNNFPFSPFRKLNSRLTKPPSFFDSSSDLERLKVENRRLKEAVNLYILEKVRLNEVLRENESLKQRLNLKPSLPNWKIIWAGIIEVYSQEILLDKGQRQGLAMGLPVVIGDIVVGRIAQLWPDRAQAILLTHPHFSVGVIVPRSGLEAVTEGIPLQNALALKYVPKQSGLLPGDEIITSGRGGVFPYGLKIGEVAKVESQEYGFFLEIKIRPKLIISQAEEVAVLFKR